MTEKCLCMAGFSGSFCEICKFLNSSVFMSALHIEVSGLRNACIYMLIHSVLLYTVVKYIAILKFPVQVLHDRFVHAYMGDGHYSSIYKPSH